MARYGLQALIDRNTQTSDASVFRYDLPVKGGLSQLDVVIRETNGGTSNKDHWIPEIINKLELVANGDIRLWSLTGEEAFRHALIKQGSLPDTIFTEAASGVSQITFPMLFGRFPHDQIYGLDLSKYQNVQLLIDYNAANGGAVGATGFLTGSFEISALMHITEAQKVPAYRGCITTREIQTWSTAASGDQVVKLPHQWPIIGIGFYCKEEGTNPWANVTNLRLSLDNDARQPIRGRYEHLLDQNLRMFGPKNISMPVLISSGDTIHPMLNPIHSALCQLVQTNWVTGATDGLHHRTSATAATDTVTVLSQLITTDKGGKVPTAIADDTNIAGSLSVTGYPGHYLYFPIGNPEDLSDALLPSEWGDGAIIATQGNAGATAAVIVEELRT